MDSKCIVKIHASFVEIMLSKRKANTMPSNYIIC